MRNRMLSMGLLMSTLTMLVFVVYQVAAEPHAQGDASTGETPSIAERLSLDLIAEAEATHSADDVIRAKVAAGPNANTFLPSAHTPNDSAKVAAGPNANAVLSLDLIPNGGAGNQRNDGVTSGTVSGRGTTIALEIFATGVTTSLVGMRLRFDFDASLVTFVKAENSAFALNLPRLPTGTDFAATSSPVTLPSSNFLARAEFTTATDVTGREFSIGITSVTLSESVSLSDTLTTTTRIAFNVSTTLTPDFDGDGTVGFSDFLTFAGRYGTRQGDDRYQAKYDLNGDGTIGFSDFLIFAGSYGTQVSPPSGGSGGGGGGGGSGGGGGGSSSSPDLIVESPSVSDSTLTPGQSFTLRATVRNRGTGQSASTTLRYYQSSNATITTSDQEVGTDPVRGLSASGTGSESVNLTAPSSTGTYYYGACVRAVSGESNTDNNCSDGVRVRVGGEDDHSNTRSGATSLSLGGSRSGRIETGGDVDYFRAQVSGSGTLTVYTTGTTDTDGRLQDSSGTTLATNDDGGSGTNFSITSSVSAGTYYIRVRGYDSSVTGSYTVHAHFQSGGGGMVGAPKMYWTDYGTDKIQRANLDGSNVEDLITAGLSRPSGLTLDVGRGKMYWTETGKIQRANLDGSNVEDLITTGLSAPEGIALDVDRGKMYWTDKYWTGTGYTGKIQRANLDGSNVEDLITTGLLEPRGLALDVGRGKMYWTDAGTGKIQRANLDGSNVEDIITTGLRSPYGISLDVGRGKMYWTDTGTDKIQRANLDGSNVEDLITTGLEELRGISLDVGRGKMYWTDAGTGKIQRANLDGSQIENISPTGLGGPYGIVLGTSGPQ